VTKKLHISDKVSLPLDAITQTFALLAVRGAGKTNTARSMAEEMYAAGLPFVAIDPVGSWFGLRSSADGKSSGLDIPIFGGRHGDVPLERAAGALLADLVVDKRMTCVLDVSEFSEGDKIRFLIDFAERLYRRNTAPLHLFLEEADDYIPQRPFREQARLLGAWENIVRRGRARGLGMTMITQRSAAINKNVLTQVETLFVMRTTSPQDTKAVEDWVKYHGASRDMLATLAKLENGEAWIWSPSWLRKFERVRIRRCNTFDSGATPKNANGVQPAAKLADVNLDSIRAQMAETIERAKANDPRELQQIITSQRRRIAELEKAPAPKGEVKRVEVPVLTAKDRAAIEKAAAAVERAAGVLRETAEETKRNFNALNTSDMGLGLLVTQLRAALDVKPTGPTAGDGAVRSMATGRVIGRVVERTPARPARIEAGTGEKLGICERKVLTALAQYPQGRTVKQIALLAGYAIGGGGFRNALGALRSAERITRTDPVQITEAGTEALGSYEPLPHGEALLQHWYGQLGKAERAVLQALAEVFPHTMTVEQVADVAGYEPGGGGFRNALGRLRTLELINGRGELRASEELFS
jgi:hypothetical protein